MAPPELIIAAGALSLVSGVVAFAVSYTAYRFYRLSKMETLAYISFGFMLLGVSLVVEGALSIARGLDIGNVVEDERLVYFMNSIYLLMDNIAYLILVVGYARAAYSKAYSLVPLVAVPPPTLAHYFLLRRTIFDVSQLISIILLTMLVYESALAGEGGARPSTLVVASFSLLLVSHATMLYASIVFTPFYYIVGELVQFVSFLVLLLFLLRGARVG